MCRTQLYTHIYTITYMYTCSLDLSPHPTPPPPLPPSVPLSLPPSPLPLSLPPSLPPSLYVGFGRMDEQAAMFILRKVITHFIAIVTEQAKTLPDDNGMCMWERSIKLQVMQPQ